MRTILVLAAFLACTAASDSNSPDPDGMVLPDRSDADPFFLAAPPGPGEAVCRDTIHTVRDERGLPRLERETADPDAPYFIAAVDRRIDGCSVMVMRNDIGDVRPLPDLPDDPPRLRPAQ